MAKRNPSNTTTSQVAAFADAKMKLAAPPGLSKQAVPFFESIAATRAPSEWSASDIDIAANLAEDKAMIVKLHAQLDKEGWIINGKISGAAYLLDMIARRVLSTSRLLQIHPRGRTGLQSRDLNARRRAAREAAATLEGLGGNPLIKTH